MIYGLTKNDLSGGLTKLDLEALKTTAALAVRTLKQECRDHLRELDTGTHEAYKDPETRAIVTIYLSAERLKDTARQLAIAADTYAALLGTDTREDIEIIRKEKKDNAAAYEMQTM